MQLLNEMSGQLEDSSLLVHHLMDKWPETVPAILKHAKLEKGRQAVSTLLSMYQLLPEESKSEGTQLLVTRKELSFIVLLTGFFITECQGLFALKLLTALLSRSKQQIVYVYKVRQILHSTAMMPYVVVFV